MKYVLANLKSYALDLLPYLETLEGALPCASAPYVGVFPPLLELGMLNNTYTRFSLGAQDAYPALEGAFSGEVTLCALEKRGVKSVLIGHSERRLLLKESDALCAQKFEFFARHGFQIVFCIGESLAKRQEGQDALLTHLAGQLRGIDLQYPKLLIAYEPIWAIGTGVSAQPQEIDQTLESLRQKLKANPLMVYGGSVQVENTEEILALEHVDGVLVGKASLDPHNLAKMVEISSTKEFA
ncbi:triose-phosphate isomerase [Helicobacter labacensis]|uniref:triose-phosphate isomerase n=1 Tax=Helicobacter labacensis TaxID=2316079 RepID=UPI000EACBF9B|nr:triose-phosphate isomerase [Helicobacter labacensis]